MSKVPSLQDVAEDYLRHSKKRQTSVSDDRNMLLNRRYLSRSHKSLGISPYYPGKTSQAKSKVSRIQIRS